MRRPAEVRTVQGELSFWKHDDYLFPFSKELDKQAKSHTHVNTTSIRTNENSLFWHNKKVCEPDEKN